MKEDNFFFFEVLSPANSNLSSGILLLQSPYHCPTITQSPLPLLSIPVPPHCLPLPLSSYHLLLHPLHFLFFSFLYLSLKLIYMFMCICSVKFLQSWIKKCFSVTPNSPLLCFFIIRLLKEFHATRSLYFLITNLFLTLLWSGSCFLCPLELLLQRSPRAFIFPTMMSNSQFLSDMAVCSIWPIWLVSPCSKTSVLSMSLKHHAFRGSVYWYQALLVFMGLDFLLSPCFDRWPGSKIYGRDSWVWFCTCTRAAMHSTFFPSQLLFSELLPLTKESRQCRPDPYQGERYRKEWRDWCVFCN